MTDHADRFRRLRAEPSSDDGGDPARAARVARTGVEARGQPEAIQATLTRGRSVNDALAKIFKGRRIARVVITGCGDSWIVGMAAKLGWERLLRAPLEAAEAFDYANYGATLSDAESLVIGLSAGGSTQIVLDALDRAKAQGAMTVGVSNTAGSAILTRYDGALLIEAERKGWPTQSSTAAIALLLDLAAALSENQPMRADLDALPALVARTLEACDPLAKEIGEKYARARLVLFAGAGPHYAPAAFGAAKIKELGPIHAYAQPLEEMHHYRAQKQGDLLFLIAPDQASHARALDTAIVAKGVGGELVALVPEDETEIAALADHVFRLPPVDDALAPLLYSTPIHLFAFHFATARLALGLGAPPPFPTDEGP